MTNEQAIKILRKGYPDIHRYATIESAAYEYDVKIYNEALDIAIHALETGEVYMNGKNYDLYLEGYKQGQSENRPQGEWLVVGHDDTTYWYRCSICKYEEHDNFTKHHHYCPNCGADMKGGKEE